MKKKKAKRLAKSSSQSEQQTIGANPTIAEMCRFFGVDDITNVDSSRLTSATYYACMLIRCNALAKTPLKLKQKTTAGGSVDAAKHSLYTLLHLRPNPFISAHDFLWATEFQRLHYGNSFWVKTYSERGFKALYLLDSQRVEIYVDNGCILDNKESVYYVYNDPKKGQISYLSDDVVHFKNFPTGGICGTSIRHYLGDIVSNEQFAQNVVKGKYKNGLQDPIVVTYTGDIDEAKKEKIKRKFAKMGGAQNAGKVIPIPTEFKVQQLETKLVNAQFFELNTLTSRQIANAFGVKSFQLNDLEKSTYSNIEQQNTAFYTDTLLDVYTAYEQEMDYKLLFDTERESGYFTQFNADVILRADLLTRYQAYQIGVTSGFEMISEVREKEDMPFVKGTDRLIIGNGASIPLDDIGKQYKGGETNEST